MMQALNDLKLIASKIELTYSGKDAAGETVMLTEEASPDPAWLALLLRYIKHHREVGQYGAGARELSLEGSAGDYPAVSRNRWRPDMAFIG